MILVLLLLLLLLHLNDAIKCYTRTLTNCHTNERRAHNLYYRIDARNDTAVDLRLGPVADRSHDWQIIWAHDRCVRNVAVHAVDNARRAIRCMPKDDYFLAEKTACS
jgi:hypothetical protein